MWDVELDFFFYKQTLLHNSLSCLLSNKCGKINLNQLHAPPKLLLNSIELTECKDKRWESWRCFILIITTGGCPNPLPDHWLQVLIGLCSIHPCFYFKAFPMPVSSLNLISVPLVHIWRTILSWSTGNLERLSQTWLCRHPVCTLLLFLNQVGFLATSLNSTQEWR